MVLAVTFASEVVNAMPPAGTVILVSLDGMLGMLPP
jgi:hypothetical protein